MPKLTKRRAEVQKLLKHDYQYPVNEAFEMLLSLPRGKMNESVDVVFKLNVDPRKSDQMVRGSVELPKGSGREVRVAVFAQGDKAEAAKAAGADLVGFEDLADRVKAGEMAFDVVVASPDAMAIVGKLGPVLGPRGLMPNPKDGTVTPNVADAVKRAKAGQARFRTDKGGNVHCSIGRVSFNAADLAENLAAVTSELRKLKPSAVKGIYMKKVCVSTTMGPGLVVDLSSLMA